MITGILYLGRSITMLVTALPVANTDYYCYPKVQSNSQKIIRFFQDDHSLRARERKEKALFCADVGNYNVPDNDSLVVCIQVNHTSALIILERIGILLSGFGLSINGRHVYCGDYIYSGHTCMLVLSALVVTECMCVLLTAFFVLGTKKYSLISFSHFSQNILKIAWILMTKNQFIEATKIRFFTRVFFANNSRYKSALFFCIFWVDTICRYLK